MDTVSGFEDYLGYADTFRARVSSEVKLSTDEMTSLAKLGFDSGDREAGTRLTELALSAAREAGDDLGKRNTFISTMRASSEAMKAWGATDEVGRAQGAHVLSAVAELIPAANLPTRKRDLTDIMTQTSGAVRQYQELGIDVGPKAPELAQALYQRRFNSAATDAADTGVGSVLNRVTALSNKIRLSAPVTPVETKGGAQPGQEQPDDGFQLVSDTLKRSVLAAGGAAIRDGTDADRALGARREELASGLLAIGIPNMDEARAAADIVTQMLVSGQELDVRRIPEMIAASTANKAIIGEGVKKAMPETATPAQVAKALPGVQDRVLLDAAQRAAKDVPKTDPATGRPLPEADWTAKVRDAAENSADYQLTERIMGVNARAIDLKAGFGDKNATVDAFVQSVAPIVPAVAFEQSPMFNYLFKEVRFGDLKKPATREAAVQKVLSSYQDKASLAHQGSTDEAALRKFAEAQVDRITGNLEDAMVATGTDPSLTPAVILGDDPANPEQKKGLARRMTVMQPAYGTLGTPTQPTRVETAAQDVAKEMAGAFFSDLGVPEDQRGFAVAARGKIMRLAALQGPAAPAAGPAQPAGSSFDLSLAKISTERAALGYAALRNLSDRLSKPIADTLARKFISSDLPVMLKDADIPAYSLEAVKIRSAARMRAERGDSADSIAEAVATALTPLAASYRAAAEAKWEQREQKKAEIRAASGGVDAFGATAPTASETEDQGR